MGRAMYIEEDVKEKEETKEKMSITTIDMKVTRDDNTGKVTVTISVDLWEKLWYMVDLQNDMIRSLSNGDLHGIPKDLIETIRRAPSKIASKYIGKKSVVA